MNISGASYVAGRTIRPAKKPVTFSGTTESTPSDGSTTPPSAPSTNNVSRSNSKLSLPGLLKVFGLNSSRTSVTSNEPTPATPKPKRSAFRDSDPFKDSERQKRANARKGITPVTPEMGNEDLFLDKSEPMRSQAALDKDPFVQKYYPGAIKDTGIIHDLRTGKIKPNIGKEAGEE